MTLTKEKIKLMAVISLSIFGLTVAAFLLQHFLTGQDQKIFQITKSLGIFGPIFLTLGVAFGGIFVPMTTLPFLLISLSLYGFWVTLPIFYLGNTIIAPVVDFYIARRWGRGVVAKMAGKKALAEIDKFAAIAGYKSLIVVRIFGGALFDSISYAVGLTKLEFKKVMLITALVSLPGQIITVLIVNQSVTVSPFYMGILLATAYLGAIISSVLIYHSGKKPQP